MKTKEEVIKEAYEPHWETVKHYVDENGWLTLSIAISLNIGEIGSKTYEFKENEKGNHKYCRIIALCGLELNKGWIEIKDRFKEPSEDVWICNCNGNKVPFYHNALNPFPKTATHYQPIVKPQPPLHK